MDVFVAVDSVHEKCNKIGTNNITALVMVKGKKNQFEKVIGGKVEYTSNFDPHALEEAIQSLFGRLKCRNLAISILLLNLYTVYGMSNSFVDVMFTILQVHILPSGNCLPKNYYVAKRLK